MRQVRVGRGGDTMGGEDWRGLGKRKETERSRRGIGIPARGKDGNNSMNKRKGTTRIRASPRQRDGRGCDYAHVINA